MKFRGFLIFFGLLVLLAVFANASVEENEIKELLNRVARNTEASEKRKQNGKNIKNQRKKKQRNKERQMKRKVRKNAQKNKSRKNGIKKKNRKNRQGKKLIEKKKKNKRKNRNNRQGKKMIEKKKKNKKKNRKNRIKKKDRKKENKNKRKRKQLRKKRRRKQLRKKTQRSKLRNKQKKNKKKTNAKRNKNKNNKKRDKKRKGCSSRQADGKCLENAVTAMTRWLRVVTNYKKQSLRIKGQKDLADKKKVKKGLFSPVLNQLVSAGGGNKSALACAGSSNSSGAAQLKNLTETLDACMKNINTSCNMEDFPKPNATLVSKCDNATADFEKEAEKCRKLSKNSTSADACNCWNGMKNASDAVVGCSRTDEQEKIKNATKKCKEAFSKCRKFEDDAVSILKSCSESPDKLKQKAAALSKNKDALAAAKAKIAKVTGSSGRRRSRRAPANNCGEFIVLAERLGKAGSECPSCESVVVIAGHVTSSADPTCTDAEKDQLSKAEAEVDAAIDAVSEALETILEAIEEATGSKPTNEELASIATETTTKAARNRLNVFKRVRKI